MSHEALIAFAPVLTLERVNDPRWNRPDRWLYDPGALRLLPTGGTKLIVDHDETQEIGAVHALARIDWHDGGPWIYASATVDSPPSWLKRNTAASFGCKAPHLRSATFGGHENVVSWGLVSEVSVLSPDRSPKEPHARVLSYGPAEARSPAAMSRAERVALMERARNLPPLSVHVSELPRPRLWDELERIVGYAVGESNWVSALHQAQRRPLDRLHAEHLAARRTEPQTITRYGIGRVVAVGGVPVR